LRSSARCARPSLAGITQVTAVCARIFKFNYFFQHHLPVPPQINLHEFIGAFDLLAIACIHDDAARAGAAPAVCDGPLVRVMLYPNMAALSGGDAAGQAGHGRSMAPPGLPPLLAMALECRLGWWLDTPQRMPWAPASLRIDHYQHRALPPLLTPQLPLPPTWR